METFQMRKKAITIWSSDTWLGETLRKKQGLKPRLLQRRLKMQQANKGR